MNPYAYPVIFDLIKKNKTVFLSIHLYDSVTTIYKRNNVICITENGKKKMYSPRKFNWYSNKPVMSINLNFENGNSPCTEVFNRHFFRAALIIQKAWKSKR